MTPFSARQNSGSQSHPFSDLPSKIERKPVSFNGGTGVPRWPCKPNVTAASTDSRTAADHLFEMGYACKSGRSILLSYPRNYDKKILRNRCTLFNIVLSLYRSPHK